MTDNKFDQKETIEIEYKELCPSCGNVTYVTACIDKKDKDNFVGTYMLTCASCSSF